MPIFDRLMNTFTRNGNTREAIAEELLFHLEEKTRANIGKGMDYASARENAVRSFGNRGLWGDRMRDADVIVWLDNAFRDLGQALRSLSRRPGLVFIAISSLALGIGSTTALFSLADSVFLRPLPFRQADEMVAIVESKLGERSNSNPVRMNDWAAQVPALSAVGGYYGEGLVLTGEGAPVRFETLRTFGRFLDVLGQRPELGRLYTPDEPSVILLSHRLWQSRYHSDKAVLGRVLHLNGASYTVIGVLPGDLRFPDPVDAIAPAPPSVRQSPRKSGFLSIVGRRKPDSGITQLNAQLSTVSTRLAQEYPATDRDRSARAIPLQQEFGSDVRRPLLLLFCAAAMVLLIACVNVASLLLSRAIERRKETTIRISLGAGKAAVIRYYLAESLLLSFGGGLVGLFLGKLALRLPLDVALPVQPVYDWHAAVFALFASIGSAIFFGSVPGWQAASARLTESYRATTSAGGLWLRRCLVIAQVSLSVLLLVSVGLIAKSLYRIQHVTLGFEPASVLTVRVNFGWDSPTARLNDYTKRVLEVLSQLPGVASVGMVDRLPLKGGTQTAPIQVRGSDLPPDLKERQVDQRAIAGDYFRAAGIPLIQGKETLQSHETIVNQTLARRYFQQADPIGRQISTNGKQYFTIVGVIGDVRVEAAQAEQPPEMFVRAEDTYWPLQNYVIRANGGSAASVREAMLRVDPNQLIDQVVPMSETLRDSSADQRTRVWLLGSFAAIALLLASFGLYGVLASDVAQRRVEIGIRLALGAEPGAILSRLVSQGVLLALAGLALGIAAALTLTRFVASLLYAVAPTDPSVYGAVTLVLIATAVAASWLPALRASRVDPIASLRMD